MEETKGEDELSQGEHLGEGGCEEFCAGLESLSNSAN